MTRERYESLPLATLKELAKARNMKGVSTLKKSALIDEMLKLDETEKQMQANEKSTPRWQSLWTRRPGWAMQL